MAGANQPQSMSISWQREARMCRCSRHNRGTPLPPSKLRKVFEVETLALDLLPPTRLKAKARRVAGLRSFTTISLSGVSSDFSSTATSTGATVPIHRFEWQRLRPLGFHTQRPQFSAYRRREVTSRGSCRRSNTVTASAWERSIADEKLTSEE